MNYTLYSFVFITIATLCNTSLLCMQDEDAMPPLVPDTEETRAIIPAVQNPMQQELSFPRTVPSLVMSSLKPACLALLEKESDDTITLFNNVQKKDAWLAVAHQITTKLGKPTRTEEPLYYILLAYRWRTVYLRYQQMHGPLGSPMVEMDYVIRKHSEGWNNEDDFLHYFDEMMSKCLSRNSLDEICNDAITYHAPQAIYAKLQALGLTVLQKKYLLHAIEANNLTHAAYLMKHGICPDAQWLQFPVLAQDLDMIKLLVEHGIDITFKYSCFKEKTTAADIAWLKNTQTGNAIVEYLDDYEDRQTKKIHSISPNTFAGVQIPEGISEYRQRWIRRLHALWIRAEYARLINL